MQAKTAIEPQDTDVPVPVRRLEIAMLACGIAAFGLLYCTQPLLPQISSDLGVDATAASLTVSLATGALALAVLPMSSLAESFGRARVMRVALVIACLLVLAGALSASFPVLLVTRTLVGVALAGVVAVAMGHLGDEVPPAVVGTAMGLYVSGNTVGGVLGRTVSGGFADLGGWRVGIGVFAGVGAVATVAFVALLPPARRFRRVPFRPAVHLGAVREHLRDPGIRRLCLIALLLMGGFVATYNYLTYRLAAAPFRLPTPVLGLVFLAYLAGTVSSTVTGRMSDRIGRARVLMLSILVTLAGLVLTVPDRLPLVVAGLVLVTAGFFGAHSVASGWVVRRATANRAQASALYLMAYYAGSSLGGSLIGLVWTGAAWPGGGWVATAITIGALDLVALALVPGIRPTR